LALTHTGNKHDAEDIFQEVFLALISKPRSFNAGNPEHLKAWLIRVTLNRCKSLRKSWFKKTVTLNENLPIETRLESDLVAYLQMLPQKYRAVIHLFYAEELPVKEISAILAAKESTVRTWLTRARAILREKLKGDYFHE